MVPVHHMEAHALTARLPQLSRDTPPQFPFLVLLISGGHALLALASDIDQYALLGSTVDNSPGEALDKVTPHCTPTTLVIQINFLLH